jgi:tripartite-type tricarboxylate transporter receptor subunit TctC
MKRRTFVANCVVTSAALGAGGLVPGALASAHAAEPAWPNKPVKLVVPFAPGGPIDNSVRPMAQVLSEILQQPVIVDNIGGGGGAIGLTRVARAAPDGYTIGYAHTGNLAIAPHIDAGTPYDPRKDFTAIMSFTTYENILVVRADSPFRSTADLLKAASERPGQLTYGSAGIGASNHLSGEMLTKLTGAKFNHVPYRGSGPAHNDLMGGHINFMFNSITTAWPFIREGKLRALATTGAKRHFLIPDTPTLSESVPGYEFSGWTGLVAPAGMPADVIKRLMAALRAYFARTDTQERLKALGETIDIRESTEVSAMIASDYAKFGELIKGLNLKKP